MTFLYCTLPKYCTFEGVFFTDKTGPFKSIGLVDISNTALISAVYCTFERAVSAVLSC